MTDPATDRHDARQRALTITRVFEAPRALVYQMWTEPHHDGSSVDTVSDFNANGSLRGRTVTSVSANGLATTIQQDLAGSGTFDRTHSDIIVVGAGRPPPPTGAGTPPPPRVRGGGGGGPAPPGGWVETVGGGHQPAAVGWGGGWVRRAKAGEK